MQHVVLFSGGVGSWAAAKRVAAEHGTGRLTLLFTDTSTEDEDLYRFLREAATNVGAPLARIAEGRDVWQVFFDTRYLGNSRVDPCSRILKREMSRRWIEDRYTHEGVTVYIGYDWTEPHRVEAMRERWAPYGVEAPMCEPPYLSKRDMLDWLKREGIEPPRLYKMGFPHNNCGGFCVKAGQGTFKILLDKMPERYAYHEGREQELRDYLGKDVSILRDWKNGGRAMTLREFRERVQQGEQMDFCEFGGCGCFDEEPKEAGRWQRQPK